MRSYHRLRGSIAPLITPFKTDNTLDLETLRTLVDWHIASGSHGLSVTGTTGEPSALTLEEREAVFETVITQAQGRVPVIPATGTNNLEETLRLTNRAEVLGADGVLVIVPYYNRPTQQGLIQYFTEVARSTALPVIIYNIPGRTATNLEPSALRKIRDRAPNVIGIKEAHRDFEQVCVILDQLGRDFCVYSGIETLCFPMLTVGGAGHISATANILPTAMADLYNLVQDNRWTEAQDLHYHLLALNQALFWETNPGPLKTALSLMGKIQPVIRLPLTLLDREKTQDLKRVLVRYHLLTNEEVGDVS